MAFDGIVTAAVAKELSETLTLGKIEKVYQPEADELVFLVHTKKGNKKLYMSCASNHACIHLTEQAFENPAQPMALCMLLRKHLHGARIAEIRQNGSERIIEIEFETQNELGFSVNKVLIIEIMGKHSNISLVDSESRKIIDCLKRVSIDVNRVRQLLPGKIYEYPPAQEKKPFWEVTLEDVERILGNTESESGENTISNDIESRAKALLYQIGGISPAIARELSGISENITADEVFTRLEKIKNLLRSSDKSLEPVVYLDEDVPREFHAIRLGDFESACESKGFDTISEAIEYYFFNKASSNRVRQKSSDLEHALKGTLEKLYLKKQRLAEDLHKAQNSENYRLYGELLNANLHLIPPGAKEVTVQNYYDGKEITISLDERFNGVKNAQIYFKKYGKAKTAVHEKTSQLEDTDIDIKYLESVVAMAENAATVEETEAIREELVEGGYLRRRKNAYAPKKAKSKPLEYFTTTGYRVLVGRNNKENDIITFKNAGNKDIWLHTKDIHGSHVILFSEGKTADELGEETMFEAAAIAAYHSQGRSSENVPVDFVPVRLVKKPAKAKPGMVIFTGNRTVWVNPRLPEKK